MSSVATIARSGLLAAQAGMQTAAQNVANTNVEGFRWQRLDLGTDARGGVQVAVSQATEPGGRLEADLVGLLQSKNAFLANLAVFKAGNEAMGSLLDSLA